MSVPISVPATYAEWSACLDILEAGGQDDEVIQAMSQGQLAWVNGVANLFSERVHGVFNTRLQRCAERMDRDFKAARDDTPIVRALLDTRRTLALLHKVAKLPSFHRMLQDHLAAEVRDYAKRAQNSLEDSAKQDRSGRLSSLIRNNPLLRYEENTVETTPAAPIANNDVVTARPQRRILL
ncbi:MAG: hypothetical protein LBQ81_07990 [Zoogloeaceae bacterium]|jgi:hypothetical protein|nr:hypothetical protein [Zoogloeaceae bacterium]